MHHRQVNCYSEDYICFWRNYCLCSLQNSFLEHSVCKTEWLSFLAIFGHLWPIYMTVALFNPWASIFPCSVISEAPSWHSEARTDAICFVKFPAEGKALDPFPTPCTRQFPDCWFPLAYLSRPRETVIKKQCSHIIADREACFFKEGVSTGTWRGNRNDAV